MGAKKQRSILGIATIVTAVLLGAPFVSAATTATADSKLTQTINPGVINTNFTNSSGVVNNPSFSLSSATVQSSGYVTTTGTFGSDTQRITVDNPGASSDGSWTLALAPTDGASATWMNGATAAYPVTDTAANGQLTVDPSGGTITAVTGGSTGVAVGSSAALTSAAPSVTLMTASTSAAHVWNGYLTNVALSQTIPAGTPAGSYTLNLTQTVTAN